ncbi:MULTISPECIES: DMT family transporter [unclassified Mesorhizobium]|uniref:DMT family transporter n=1 Tax=unclassified Mesorhizobium TaxID=325217 RepID=UPI0008EEE0E7|nr:MULTISPECIES: DMT family transporter [unclassified Mesorhizobium]RJG44948.1 DMT family transporter [Mesorhizobium sp. DCY119]SFT79170.1 Permease of the drug/metabolite transporter (DMT) superfamily [Mesorhizobium sp. YR577]
MALSPNLRGAMFMVVSMAGFTCNDALIKLASMHMNFGQVILVRGLFATTLITLLAWHQGALKMPRLIFHPMIGLRVLGELGGTIFFLIALQHLPIANVSAVLQALPLAVTMGAALFLGEGVGWRRWLAIVAGFTGVMVIVRPGFEGFNIFALSALISVAFCALRDLATRRLPPHVPSLLVSAVTATVIMLCGAVLITPLGGWTPMEYEYIALLGLAAVLVLVGYQFVIMSMRTGDISFIAPFRYTALLWAIVLGYLIFGDIPDIAMIVGAIIIVSSGLYTLYREQVAGKTAPAAQSTSPAMAPDGI